MATELEALKEEVVRLKLKDNQTASSFHSIVEKKEEKKESIQYSQGVYRGTDSHTFS